MDGVHRLDRLAGVHPDLCAAVHRIVSACGDLGLTLVVTQGLRTADQQSRLFALGRSEAGKIVTMVDGHRKKSMHQAQDDGFGHAVDVAWRTNGAMTWDGPWDTLGELVRAQGMTWGGDWVHFPDRPHIEIPNKRQS